jgi:outer membrane protein assembly factor BamB
VVRVSQILLAVAMSGCVSAPGAVVVSVSAAPVPAAAPAPAAPRTFAPLPEVRDEDWPMFRDDVERSGFAEGSRVGPKVEVLWQIPAFNTTAYGAAKGSPSVVGDVLYCGTDTGRFLAARVEDGEILWQVRFDRTSHGVHGSPAIVGDVVYIGAYDGTLYALERMTGLLLWRHKVGYQVGSSPAVVPRWGLVFSSHERSDEGGGYVVALDARTGEEVWRQPTEAHPHSSVAVDVSRDRVFVGDNHGLVYAFEAHTGREAWRRQLDAGATGKADVKATPMVLPEKGLVVFGAWSGKVYALDEATGGTVWEHATGGKIMGSTAYLAATSTVFAVSPRGFLHAIDADTGRSRWTLRVGASLLSSPAVSGDGRAVVFGAGDGSVYAVHADTGAPLWDLHLGGQLSGSPALVGDRIYVTGQRGALWALRTHD